jgi:hypothetical protein
MKDFGGIICLGQTMFVGAILLPLTGKRMRLVLRKVIDAELRLY